jgi:hypothetical protein
LVNPDVIPRKTERAREALKARAALPHNQRMFLIMVDGRKSLRELAQVAGQLGIDEQALAAMARDGLLQLRRPPGAPVPPAVVAEPEPAPAAPRALPSMAAVKLYAIDLMALMLPGQDGPLRESARQLTDPAGMRLWLNEAATQIAARASDERAQLFMARVGDMLPPGFLVQLEHA